MPIPDNITRSHVEAAVADYNAGVPHRFGQSTGYDLLYEGTRYPPKAILGLAAKHAAGILLVPKGFSGGEESKCFRILRELGFTVIPKEDLASREVPQRNVAAMVFQANPALYDLDEYLSRHTFIYWNCPRHAGQVKLGMPVFVKRSGVGGGIVAKGAVAELPVLKSAAAMPEHLREDLWRVPPGEDFLHVGIQLDDVRLTMSEGMIPTNVLESLPALTGHPLVTVRQGTVFRLSSEQAIGLFREWGGESAPSGAPGDAVEEGMRRLVMHQRIERSRKLVEDKKEAFRQQYGCLFCEVCHVDHDSTYGDLWSERAIEAHHLKPLGELAGACQTSLDDLLLVCCICHALIHQSGDVEENLANLQRHFGLKI